MPNFDTELTLIKPVIGIDEVGRGPLAGPVISCACVFFNYSVKRYNLNILNNSKKLTKTKREKALKLIYKLKSNKILKFSLGYASVNEIDSLNILEATKLSMQRAIKKLCFNKGSIIVDGNIKLITNNFSCTQIIKGDQKSVSIATASIVAKVHRDRYMSYIGNSFPSYNWKKNSGYGTKEHIKQIHINGITTHHRKSFEPIKKLIHS